MQEEDILNQNGAENSINYQAREQIFNNYGISYVDAREIAMTVFKENFIILSDHAAKVAKKRAEELVEKYLNQLHKREPESIANLDDPGILHSLFIAQKDYARTGDSDLLNILVDLLVDRTKLPQRTLKQIVVDESITVATKLTNNQLDTLTLIFLINHSIHLNIKDIEILKKYTREEIEPFVNDLSKEQSLFQHLDYCGCATVTNSYKSLEDLYLNKYNKLFSTRNDASFFLNDVGPVMIKILDVWNNSDLRKTTLTSVGIALAQANFRRKTGQNIDLSIWIK